MTKLERMLSAIGFLVVAGFVADFAYTGMGPYMPPLFVWLILFLVFVAIPACIGTAVGFVIGRNAGIVVGLSVSALQAFFF